MRKLFITIIGILLLQISHAQKWNAINLKTDKSFTTNLIRSTNEAIVIDVAINGFYSTEVETPKGSAVIISNDDMAPLSEAGNPNLPSLSIPIIINDFDKMVVRVDNIEYIEYNDVDVAPSKGDFSRKINPEDVPYTYGDVYQRNEFFPSTNVNLDTPYILRDFRAQNIIITPFAYNPASRTLKVFHKMRIEVIPAEGESANVLSRRSAVINMDPEFDEIYSRRFINYKESNAKYQILEEEGDLLIICHDEYLDAMQPFVEWKRATGRETTIVGTSVAGSTADNIKSYISNRYADNPTLTHILLVGDVAHIPGKNMNATGYSGYSDWWYGQLSGNDYYNELIIGRFSAESVADVTTQVNKVIHYERDIDENASWLTVGQGVSKRENIAGHYGEDDYQHIDNIREDLLDYNYTEIHRDYLNVSGVTASAATVSEHINAGVGIINYCNHGSPTSWGVFSYNNNHVNDLTNDNKLPYIISVACNNGEYTYSRPCFAETWLRATNDETGNPTGAIGGMFSYISQPWIPPMYGQDEMIDIFVESYTNNIKRTMGGVSINGNMKILDIGQNSSQYYGTYNTWNLFGDPTLVLRNDVPEVMNVSHYPEMSFLSTSFLVNASNAEGANATLTKDGEIMGTAVINNGSAVINFDAPMQNGEATLTVFAYNKVTYQATINIVEEAIETLILNVVTDNDVIPQGASTACVANVYGGSGSYSYSWTPSESVSDAEIHNPVMTPSETTTYKCTVNDGEMTVCDSLTIFVVTAPTNLCAEVVSNNVLLSWDEAMLADNYIIYRDDLVVADDVMTNSFTDVDVPEGNYLYTVVAVYENVESPKSETANAIVYELRVTASSNPGFIAEGESATLYATVTGAGGELLYDWEPSDSLEDSNAATTAASPTKSTTYKVTVSDGHQKAVATVLLKVLSSPENLTATLDGNNVNLEWDEVEYADYYMILRDGEDITAYPETTSYIDENVADGNHCYQLKSMAYSLASPASDEVCVDIYGCKPPKNLTAKFYSYDEEYGAVVDWDREETFLELTEYRIYRSTDNVNYKLVQTLVNVPSMNHYQFSDMTNSDGTYYYKVSAYYANADCESEFGLAANSTDDFVFVEVVSLNDNFSDKIKVYPNPVKDKLKIEAEYIGTLTVVNMMGQVVSVHDVDSDEFVLDVNTLESGMYLLKVETMSGVHIRQINVVN